MCKWYAACTTDEGATMFIEEVEAVSYGAAYIKVICKLPSECARGDSKNGIGFLSNSKDEVVEYIQSRNDQK